MKTTIKILTILSIIFLFASCAKEEQPTKPLKKGINIIKTTQITKSSMVDSSAVMGHPGHIKFPPVYGEE